MRDSLSISCTPYDEECEQLGPNYRPEIAKAECRAFANQIRRVCGQPPEGARLKIASNPHDFGSYHEVEVVYDDRDREAMEYAFKVEGADLATWDDEARKELSEVDGYPLERLNQTV